MIAAIPAILGACSADEEAARPVAAAAPAAPAAPPRPEQEPRASAPGRPAARVEISQTQASFIGSVAWGRGTLHFQGRRYPFRVRGLGVGGFGVARLTAAGEVYNMARAADFAGVYGQLRAGMVAGEAELRGGVWLQNPAGVRINLRPRREGLALQLGADGVLIELA